jgi:hypothetical protein
MVTWNFEAIQLMIQAAQQDNMTFLAKPATSKICYREDSPASEGSNITNTDSASLRRTGLGRGRKKVENNGKD